MNTLKRLIEKLGWLWNRLRCMSLPEIAHRVREKYLVNLQRFGGLSARVPPPPNISEEVKPWFCPDATVSAGTYIEEAARVLTGSVNIFALRPADLGCNPAWNADPKSGICAPLVFGRTLDYRNAELVGDIKYLWEPNRHLQWVVLAQTYALTGEKRSLDGLEAQLSSWLEQCPYPLGPNWTSSLELGIRLINWSIVWQLIGGANSPMFSGEAGQALRRRWLDSIYQHCHTLNIYWSRFSSANNHLIGEAAGLYIGAITWPFWEESKEWQKTSFSILLEESLKQNTQDGVNREQAISYQQFVLDFLLFSGLAARSAGDDFPAAYWTRLEDMIGFLASIMDVSGNIPMIGDADDGYVSRFSPAADFCPYKSLLATGALLFDRPEYLHKAGAMDDKTQWLLGSQAVTSSAAQARQLPLSKCYAEGGYYLLGSDFETENEVRCLVDVGPLGYLGIAAHGHADALSLALSVGGIELLVDPGTYAYHTKKVWRDYFRGTLAHNTVRIDGLDQSEPGGNFMWLAKAEASCEAWECGDDRQRLLTSHDGYQRLDDPVTHRREIEYCAQRRMIQISDEILCSGVHTVERMWHFAETCEVTVRENAMSVTCGPASAAFEFKPQDNREIILYRGSEEPVIGWISRAYDVKEPITTAVEKFEINGPTTLIMNINL